jgi:uncharacterized protein (DUF488 family)
VPSLSAIADIVPRTRSAAGRESSAAGRVYTIGHSTHELEPFMGLLRRHGIRCLVDVRAFPSSRRVPHFNADPLRRALAEHGTEYRHIPELGGRRRARPESPNSGWRVAGFRAYADHMETAAFESALESLCDGARTAATAVMCAEGPWWRCHRRLIADALLVRGFDVEHIGPRGELTAHELPGFAVVEDGRLSYPAEQPSLEM